ncbi:head maturation protease, ClpP-related [Caloramator australicus]|uniref:ATP-dependent Clp protease proteolytic subunit n=1 Tax=Caloramator australicus RC3 TaxID=857293 RepID=I7LIE8_9CLOT|nr:head maturation protease, ClpP-related [Caloramator australicus]CCJ32882.1 Prophage Clp protease-like protein [Caloramator australicus RC3]
MNKFWQFKNTSEDTAELILYGPIADSTWWGDEVTPKNFAEDLKNLGDIKNLVIRINSVGGDVFAANAIYTLLKDHKANKTVKIDGIAASAATIIAMAGDTIEIPANGMMMIHNPMVVLLGAYNAEELNRMQDTLDSIKKTIIAAYKNKTGKSEEELSKLMDEETWMTGEEAVKEGFADKLMFENVNAVLNGNKLYINNIGHDLTAFRKKPNFVQQAPKPDNINTNQNQKEDKVKMEIKTVADLEQHFKNLVEEIRNKAKEEERERIKAIDEIAKNIDPELVMKAKYVEPMNAEKLAFEAIKNDAAKGSNYLNDLEKDIKDSNVLEVEAKVVKDNSQDIVNKIVEGANKRRGK